MTRIFQTLPILAAALTACHAFVPQQQTSSFAAARPRHSGSTRLFSSAAASSLPEGLLKTVSKPGNGPSLRRGEVATVKYSCYLPGETTKPPFAKSSKQKVVVGDGGMIDGWEIALQSMKVGERSVVRIQDPSLGYGAQGFPPVIPPNAEIEVDLEVLEVSPPISPLDFDNMIVDNVTPMTAESIQAAYEERMRQKALAGPEKEGLEAWIDKAKNFYFFGFFEGETGQQAPWFLRPAITFPLAFLAVGALFYITFAFGGITERGAPSTDELDEIIVSSTATVNTLLASAFVSDVASL